MRREEEIVTELNKNYLQMKKKFEVLDSEHGKAIISNLSLLSLPEHITDVDDAAAPLNDHTPVLNSTQSNVDYVEEGRLSKVVIPVLLLVCNRPGLTRSLNNLLSHRLKHFNGIAQFPVYVSQDCNDSAISDIILSYGDNVTRIVQPDQSVITIPQAYSHYSGYYKISRHYKWALDEILIRRNHELVIIMEDDLDISVDFYDYFLATAPFLLKDKSLLCVSAWNDNGKESLIDVTRPDLLHRTDFFPGLGWMLSKLIWTELRDIWPAAFWDDFLRDPKARKGRSCIRPELSRTINFGRVGVSQGLFFDKHLRFIYLNTNAFNFTSANLSYLQLPAYDENFRKAVYVDALPIDMTTLDSLHSNSTTTGRYVQYRLEYTTSNDFVSKANHFGLMTDFRANVPRTAYKGVVSIFFRGLRIYLAPPSNWTSY